MIPLYSKRNQVYAAVFQGRAAVEKHFTAAAGWERETALYAALEGALPLPEVLRSWPPWGSRSAAAFPLSPGVPWPGGSGSAKPFAGCCRRTGTCAISCGTRRAAG